MTARRIIDAYADWDDPHAFRVFLVREDEDGVADLDNAEPMESVFEVVGNETVEGRIYKAAFVKCPRDIGYQTDRVLGWPKEAPAKRVAKAVKAELVRIAKGKPGPSDGAVRLTLAMLPRKGARR